MCAGASVREEERRLRALVGFYDSFLKLTLKGLRDVVGERGALSVLKFAAREYGARLAKGFQALSSMDAKEALEEMLKRAGTEPSVTEEGGVLVITLRKCPFRRPEEEPLLCAITEGLIEGFLSAFKKARIHKQKTLAEGADSCVFSVKVLG